MATFVQQVESGSFTDTTTDGDVPTIQCTEAAAGAGKTFCLVTEVKRVLGDPSATVLCFTFTKNAANEMKERLRHPEAEYRVPRRWDWGSTVAYWVGAEAAQRTDRSSRTLGKGPSD